MKNVVGGVLAVLVIVLGVYHFNKNKEEKITLKNNNPIKIGAILPLSGDFAMFGEAINKGALLAINEAKASGLDVAYISEDDRSNAAGSTNAANKLVNSDHVDASITATVQEVKPAASIFEDSNTPLLATWDSNDYIKGAGKEIFTIGFSTEGAGYKMAEYAKNNLKLSKVAGVAQIDEWSQLIEGAFEKRFKQLGGAVVVNERISPTQKDFRTVLSKIKSSGAEGIYFPFLPNSISPFLKQSSELGIKAVMMTGDSISQEEVKDAGITAENLYFTNLYAENIKSLSERYKAKYNEEPSDITFVSFGYDGANTLISAVLRKRKENISVGDALRKTSINGLDHKIDFSGKQYSEKLEHLYKVMDGEFIEVEK